VTQQSFVAVLSAALMIGLSGAALGQSSVPRAPAESASPTASPTNVVQPAAPARPAAKLDAAQRQLLVPTVADVLRPQLSCTSIICTNYSLIGIGF
jgi:hypothetical protein